MLKGLGTGAAAPRGVLWAARRKGVRVRVESSVTSLSWIPREAVRGIAKLPFGVIAHYDPPPPEVLEDLEGLRAADRFRFANELRAWVEVEDGRIVTWGQEGGGSIGATRLALGGREAVIAAVPLPDIRLEPVVSETAVRFTQTSGGRTGLPAPRRVHGKPFVQIAAPIAWTTLSLAISLEGTTHELVGASAFPRHWIYDASGQLVSKSGLIDFRTWYRDAFGKGTPWGGYDSPALVAAVESALERQLSAAALGGGASPVLREIAAGTTLVHQGEAGEELFLLFDGVLEVEVDGAPVATLGPGSILGERALFESGRRVATLRATTPCRVFVLTRDQFPADDLAALARTHGHGADG
jgi:cyclic nucleotide-binding protein